MLDERSRRIWAGTEAKAIGRGGQLLIASNRFHKNTVSAGVKEINEKQEIGKVGFVNQGREKKDYLQRQDVRRRYKSTSRSVNSGRPRKSFIVGSKVQEK
ncbi:MAG: hypothetical protein HQK67_06250 [Desulfamplus sp.]|nr:hypothetical protein [Desulfamplus sp.]